MASHPYLEAVGPIAFAHRGGTEAFPENTLRAFRHAASLGFTHLETDVHATSDGVAVAFHDDALDRVTDSQGVVSELPWRTVRRALVGGTDPVLRLEELLEELPGARFNIDPKSDAAVEPLVEVLKRQRAVDRVCVCSFSGRRTRRVRQRLGEGLCVGAAPVDVVRLLLDASPLPFRAPGEIDAHAAQVPVRSRGLTIVRPAVIEAAHQRGIALHVWTIDDPGEMHRLLDMGVDGIMTDRPQALRQVMTDRGLWPA